MKRVQILLSNDNGDFIAVDEFDTVAEARNAKVLGGLRTGTYHIVSIIEANIEVKEPEPATANTVTRGETFITRTRKSESEE